MNNVCNCKKVFKTIPNMTLKEIDEQTDKCNMCVLESGGYKETATKLQIKTNQKARMFFCIKYWQNRKN